QVPAAIYYIPNFITEAEEESLIQYVNSAPIPKWTQLSNRRLQNWGGLPHPKGMVPEKIPEWLDSFGQRIGQLGVFDGQMPNHVLVNEYLPGQGIMPHTDGPLYFPTVSTITLGSHTLLDFYTPLNDRSSSFDDRHFASFLLERRSLVLVREEMYSRMLHGIKEVETDTLCEKVLNLDSSEHSLGDTLARNTRISLTIRVVPKVLKAKLFFGKKK
ncbi:hypothetical protein CAPTEDRAFT_112863, partial [Capitella teleta]